MGASLVIYIVINSINPIFETICRDKAKDIATNITNKETTNIMFKYQYEELFKIEKDTNENIQLISANVLKINQITSDIALEIQKTLNNNKDNMVKIPLGSITGVKILAGRGPNINVKVSSVGNIKTDLKSEFEEKSINQTLHKVFLEIECEVDILTPFETINESITNQILIAENVIVGTIPEIYYNLHGFENNNDFVEVAK